MHDSYLRFIEFLELYVQVSPKDTYRHCKISQLGYDLLSGDFSSRAHRRAAERYAQVHYPAAFSLSEPHSIQCYKCKSFGKLKRSFCSFPFFTYRLFYLYDGREDFKIF